MLDDLMMTSADGETYVAERVDDDLVVLRVFAPASHGGGLLRELTLFSAEIDDLAALLKRAAA
ncbi:hypothetical protein PBI_MAUREEN_59 [Arthrobacter phage Maureen]